MKIKILFSMLAAFAVMAFTACSDDDDDNGPSDLNPGTFEATVSGDHSGQYQGAAYFATSTDPDTQEQVFFVSMADETSTFYFAREGGIPPAATYTIGNMEEGEFEGPVAGGAFLAWMTLQDGDNFVYIFSRNGSITIDAASQNSVRAEFTYTGEGFILDDPETTIEVTISGIFNAVTGIVNP